MAWINDNNARWEPELNAGRVIYWLTTTVAALIAIFAVADFFINLAEGARSCDFAFVAAALVWLIGRICRSLLA